MYQSHVEETIRILSDMMFFYILSSLILPFSLFFHTSIPLFFLLLFLFSLSQYQSWIYLLCGLLIYGLERLLRLIRGFYSVVVIKVCIRLCNYQYSVTCTKQCNIHACNFIVYVYMYYQIIIHIWQNDLFFCARIFFIFSLSH